MSKQEKIHRAILLSSLISSASHDPNCCPIAQAAGADLIAELLADDYDEET